MDIMLVITWWSIEIRQQALHSYMRRCVPTTTIGNFPWRIYLMNEVEDSNRWRHQFENMDFQKNSLIDWFVIDGENWKGIGIHLNTDLDRVIDTLVWDGPHHPHLGQPNCSSGLESLIYFGNYPFKELCKSMYRWIIILLFFFNNEPQVFLLRFWHGFKNEGLGPTRSTARGGGQVRWGYKTGFELIHTELE